MKRIIEGFRRSIKWRFTAIFIALITGIMLLIISVNSFFLETYYTQDKVKLLENAYEVMDAMIQTTYDMGGDVSLLLPEDYDATDTSTETPATRYIRQLNETYNISIIIVDTRNDEVFGLAGDWRFLMARLERHIFGSSEPFQQEIVQTFDNYTIERNQDRHMSSIYLESWGFFSDNTTSFIMSMPISSIQEAVGFFNHFLIFIGVTVLLGGAVIVYFASRQVAKPINGLARLSEKMSNLDFTAKYTGNAKDEIGTLGHSMNKLSDTLEKTIGELKTANNELQSDIENKMLLDKRRQEFVANVSHELKTPIALIQGYAEGLQDGMAEEPESRDYYCSVIVDEAAKMNKMVRQLMNLSSLEQGMDLPAIELFDLSTLVQGVLMSADILIRQRQAEVEVDIPEQCMVWADEFKIEEVITNYLNNALNHLEAPNRIRIYTEICSMHEEDTSIVNHEGGASGESAAGRKAEMNAAESAAEEGLRKPLEGRRVIRLHVSNTGKQIPEEDLEQIWEKFFKVDKAHTRSYGGTGLGLSIVKAIADAHHQSCGVQNTAEGVDFWFSLDAEQ